jgi:hypothetical protein
MKTMGFGLAAFIATGAMAQQQPSPTPPPAEPAAGQQALTAETPDNDIVITGYRLRKDLDTTARYPSSINTRNIARRYDNAERQAKCAAHSKLSDRSLLRKVVDGEFNSSRHAYAQDRLARIYATCGEGSAALVRTGAEANELQAASAMSGDTSGITGGVDPFPLGHSIYDRGAYTIQALKQFAPDLVLTRGQTDDPEVQRRYNMREIPRNRFRLPADARYFEVATCMVRLEPGLAVQLAMSDGTARFGDLQAALIDKARPCVGGAKSVQVDPTQFRLYIADAVYRWAEAAQNKGSLIPSS